MASTMTNIFGATSTTEDVLSGIDLRGKRILITGVSAGLGIETVRSLAAYGAQVIGAARNLAKAEIDKSARFTDWSRRPLSKPCERCTAKRFFSNQEGIELHQPLVSK